MFTWGAGHGPFRRHRPYTGTMCGRYTLRTLGSTSPSTSACVTGLPELFVPRCNLTPTQQVTTVLPGWLRFDRRSNTVDVVWGYHGR
jgi:putative SOS response-associated peptidase YedK